MGATTVNLHTLPQPQRERTLREMQDQGFGRRVYAVATTHADSDQLFRPDPVLTDLRLGHLVRWMFRMAFHGQPTDVWHRDGFMAQAWDAMGNSIELQQLNYR